MQLKDISGEGHNSYLAYSSDTHYKEDEKQLIRQDSNYYSTLKYRQKLTKDFDKQWFTYVFGNSKGKVTAVYSENYIREFKVW